MTVTRIQTNHLCSSYPPCQNLSICPCACTCLFSRISFLFGARMSELDITDKFDLDYWDMSALMQGFRIVQRSPHSKVYRKDCFQIQVRDKSVWATANYSTHNTQQTIAAIGTNTNSCTIQNEKRKLFFEFWYAPTGWENPNYHVTHRIEKEDELLDVEVVFRAFSDPELIPTLVNLSWVKDIVQAWCRHG